MKRFKFLIIIPVSVMLILSACGGSEGDNDGGGSAGNTVINIEDIDGITPPVLGALPETEIIETEQFTGTVDWDGGWDWSPYFGGNKSYTATITLTAKSGYTLTGVPGNFFRVAGATIIENDADSGIVTAIFPATSAVTIGDAALGGKVVYILQSGDPGYVEGEQRGFIVADSDMGAGLTWAVAGYQTTAVPGGTGTALGTGFVNTEKIIAQNGAGTGYMAGLARAYTGGGYTDWYLPSKDELNKFFINRNLTGFTTNIGCYWSSSECLAQTAYIQSFTPTVSGTPAGNQSGAIKSYIIANPQVRPFRSF